MPPLIITSPYSLKHDTHASGIEPHPECADRIEVLEDLLAEAPFKNWPRLKSDIADEEQILAAHTEDYLFNLQDKTPEHGHMLIDGDTVLCPDSYTAALYSAGTVCLAVDEIFNQEHNTRSDERPPACGHDGPQNTHRVFCATRPPGHHAEPNTAMGFCFFNNIFVGARHAQQRYGVKKIAILDFDVHHGNGTETMTRAHNIKNANEPIFYISTHGFPLFPMSGNPEQNDNTTLNIHLPEGCDSQYFRKTYEKDAFPALEFFAPDLLMLSSGFDAHKDDPLAPLNLETDDYGWLTRKICELLPKTPIISVLEGGYHLQALKSSVRAHLTELGK